MFGLAEWRDERESCAPKEKRIGGVRFLAVGLRRGDGLRVAWSLRRAARALERHGIRQSVFPTDFGAYALFSERGIRPVDVFPLRAALSAAIVRRVMEQEGLAPQRTTVALCASRVTRAYAAAAESLVREVRYLQLCVPRGGGELAQTLRSRFGAAVPTLSAPEGADLMLCFEEVCTVPSSVRGLVLPLCDDALRVEYAPLREEEEHGAEREQLIAALYASLALRAEDITVTRVYWEEDSAVHAEK